MSEGGGGRELSIWEILEAQRSAQSCRQLSATREIVADVGSQLGGGHHAELFTLQAPAPPGR